MNDQKQSSKLFYSLFFPSLFVLLLWLIKAIELLEKTSFASYGLYPRKIEGLIGIVTTPLLHGNVSHLAANTLPLLILGPIIFYFYRDIAFKIFFWVYFITGLWVWTLAKDAYHIGASGIIYGFEAFLFFSGVFRKDPKLLTISLLVVFLYGGTLWGVLPIKKGISWESHLFGALAGLLTAYHFRDEGPKKREYDFGDEEDELEFTSYEEVESTPLTPEEENQNEPTTITYTYIPKDKDNAES